MLLLIRRWIHASIDDCHWMKFESTTRVESKTTTTWLRRWCWWWWRLRHCRTQNRKTKKIISFLFVHLIWSVSIRFEISFCLIFVFSVDSIVFCVLRVKPFGFSKCIYITFPRLMRDLNVIFSHLISSWLQNASSSVASMHKFGKDQNSSALQSKHRRLLNTEKIRKTGFWFCREKEK